MSPDARESRVATTDAQGRFEIRELPAGRYTMTASKGGFVSLQYGQRRPSESGTPIELADAQTIDKITIALAARQRARRPRHRRIRRAGRQRQRHRVRVTAMQAGARRMVPAPGANSRDTTDDQGQFRLFGLPPGEYYVSAMLRSGGPEVTDPMGEPPATRRTYYPGTTNIGEAQRVTLAVVAGKHQRALRLDRHAAGARVGPGDDVERRARANGMVMLVPASAGGGRAMLMQQGGAGNRIDQTGAFRLPNVAPGRYQVQARAGCAATFELARMDLVVGSEDVDGLTLVTAPGAVVTAPSSRDTGEPFDFRAQQLQIVGAARVAGDARRQGPAGRAARAWATTGRSRCAT